MWRYLDIILKRPCEFSHVKKATDLWIANLCHFSGDLNESKINGYLLNSLIFCCRLHEEYILNIEIWGERMNDFNTFKMATVAIVLHSVYLTRYDKGHV